MSDVESVKFALKEINIEVLDRYRWKLEDSVKEMVAESQKYDTKYAKADKDSKPCNAQYELAYAIAQAERRLNKFEREVSGLLAIAQASLVFAEKARVSVIDYKNQASLNFAASADTEVKICNLGHSLSEKEEMKKLGAKGKLVLLHGVLSVGLQVAHRIVFAGRCEVSRRVRARLNRQTDGRCGQVAAARKRWRNRVLEARRSGRHGLSYGAFPVQHQYGGTFA